MLKLWTMLTCILFLASMGASQAAPLDSSDTVYINGLPCSRACQSYMAWYRQVSRSRQMALASQRTPSRLAQQSLKVKSQRTTRIRENKPSSASPIRVAKKVAPKSIEVPAPKIVDLQPTVGGEAKSAPSEKITESPPISNPTSSSDVGTKPDQVAAAPAAEDLTTVMTSPAPAQKAYNNAKPSGPAEATPSADAETTGLATPNIADQLVAVLLVRPEIKSVSDLANKIVAIDLSRSDSVPSVKAAIVAAGAADVQMSEGERLALVRVMDGDVPAAVLTIAAPEEAEKWSGISDFNVLRIPLSTPSGKARRG